MNEQQLQQMLINAQQAIAALATSAVINSLLNPQQAGAGLLNANALTDPTSNDLQQQQTDSRQQSPVATSSPANLIDGNNGIQELLLQLQQQAARAAAGPAAGGITGLSQPTAGGWAPPLQPNLGGSPMSHSPVSSRHINQQQSSSNNNIQQSNQLTPNKKLKRHHQSPAQQLPPQNRNTLEPTSKPQHSSTPKSHSLANLGNRTNPSNTNTSSSSSSSSAFLTNNVGLPRKLVRGQDVWLGRGAEQTRQILKCMWCGQSFRTLAEMTQHMKITQHYTNIISQEQITSWRQPESSDNKSNKQPAQQARSLDDNHDDMSDRYNESDRDDSFSNDDELPQQPPQARNNNNNNNKSRGRAPTAIKRELTPANDNSSTAGSIKEETSPIRHSSRESSSQQRQSSTTTSLKPLTRSRRRENEEDHQTSNDIPEDMSCRENSSPASNSSTSQQRLSMSVLGDLNEDSETNKESKRALKTDENSQDVSRVDSEDEQRTKGAEIKMKRQPEDESRDGEQVGDDDNDDDDHHHHHNEDNSKQVEDVNQLNGDQAATSDKEDEIERHDKLSKEDDESSDDRDDDVDRADQEPLQDALSDRDSQEKDNNDSEKVTKKSVRRREPDPIVASSAPNSSDAGGAKVLDSGDPLSELETMVEKSFDPRLRPGISNGGILQRLGIDEEVCPPWQHINYANWYAAAAYGHPMAAALLAAGINLQNGIKLSKNTTPKDKEED